jgi:hypothetical protein
MARLLGPQATILCRQGDPIDPRHFPDREAFLSHIRAYYSHHHDRLGHIA